MLRLSKDEPGVPVSEQSPLLEEKAETAST
jgi:hypothetical protein